MNLVLMKKCLTGSMDLSPGQLVALVAIADHGSFEAAARDLHVTPSAISQRVRALETAAGRVLVRRGSPCEPTEAGAALVRLGRQVQVLYAEALAEDATAELAIAVNADSLATWFRPVVSDVAGWGDLALRLLVDDQAHSHDLLRAGDVVGAVTSDPAPVQGCTVTALGHMAYRPVATPGLVARHPRRSQLPMVVFNEKDTLQDDELRRHRLGPPPLVHRVPSSEDFRFAVLAGLGWGMLPEVQAEEPLASGRLVHLCGHTSRVSLYWQRWKLASTLLDRLSDTVLAAAGTGPGAGLPSLSRRTP